MRRVESRTYGERVDAVQTVRKDSARGSSGGSGARGQARDRCAEMGIVIVPEFDDVRVAFKGRLNDAALDAGAASVDQAHFRQAGSSCRGHEFINDGYDVARGERVEIELAFDGDSQRFVRHAQETRPGYARRPGSSTRCGLAVYSALTVVLMPPRTEKSPTTVIRRG